MAAKNGSDIFYCVSPGPVATDLIKTAPWYNRPEAFERIPQRRFADPDEIAELITMLATENLPIIRKQYSYRWNYINDKRGVKYDKTRNAVFSNCLFVYKVCIYKRKQVVVISRIKISRYKH